MDAAAHETGPPSPSPASDDDLLAAAFDDAPTPMLVVDAGTPQVRVVTANAALCALVGRTAEAIRRSGLELLHADASERASLERPAALLVAGGEVTLATRRSDGSTFPARIAIGRLGASPRHAVLAYRDAGAEAALRDALAAAQAEIARSIDERASDLRAALDEKTALLHEVDHRVKNNLQVISSLILLKARRTQASATRGALNSMAERIGALSTVHRLLYVAGEASRLDLEEFMTDFGADLAATTDPSRISLSIEADPIAVAGSKAAPLALLVHELATNAVRHGFPEGASGHVAVAARREADAIRLVVEDDGIGLAAGAPNPEAFGRTLVDMVVRQMRGEIVWEELSPGTRAAVRIPLDPKEVDAP